MDNTRSGAFGVNVRALKVIRFCIFATEDMLRAVFHCPGVVRAASSAVDCVVWGAGRMALRELRVALRADGRRAVGGHLRGSIPEMGVPGARQSWVADSLPGIWLGRAGDFGGRVHPPQSARSGVGAGGVTVGDTRADSVHGKSGGVRGGDRRVAVGAQPAVHVGH